jgi:hypothetical protein
MTTETPEMPQAGIAQALNDLSDQTRVLVKDEVDSALREVPLPLPTQTAREASETVAEAVGQADRARQRT